MTIPDELVEQFSIDNGAVFVGAGLSIGASLPSWAELVGGLVGEIGVSPSDASYQDIAQYFENEFGRNRLITRLHDELDIFKAKLTRAHEALAQLSVNLIITTNYDNLLEQALEAAGRKVSLIKSDVDISFWSNKRLQLVKLHGDLQQPESIVLTSHDYEQFAARRPGLIRVLAMTLQTRTVLFIGYSATDPDFRLILSQVRAESGPFARNAYTIQFGANDLAKKELERRGLKVIDLGLETPKTEALFAWLYDLNQKVVKRKFVGGINIGSTTVDDTIYRKWLQDYTDAIPIRGIGAKGSQEARRFPLRTLYTELHTQREGKRVTLTNIVTKTPLTAILGDPGTGKSTFLRYLARTSIENLGQPLPLLFSVEALFEHVARIQQNDPSRYVGREYEWIVSYWCERSQAFDWGFTEPWLKKQLELGQVILLLDGLDELPNDTARSKIVQIIEAATTKWNKCSWILTSRRGSLKGKITLVNFSIVEIDLLDDEDIRAFIRAWTNLVFSNTATENGKGYQAEQYERDLYRSINERKDVRVLARNPFMLTAMALIHWNERRLPEGRADLYEVVIDKLIEIHHLPRRIDDKKTRQCYQLLALEMFQPSQGRQIEVGFQWAAEKISRFFEGKTEEEKTEAAKEFLFQEEIDTGILIQRGEGNIAFRHLSFQEYLAACEIASKTDGEQKGWWALIKDHLNEAEWAEVLRFVPVRLLKLGDERVDLFLVRILKNRKEQSLKENAQYVGLLGPILFDLAVYKYSPKNVKEYELISAQVMQIFEEKALKQLDLQSRFDAAVALGKGGDPRLFKPEKNWIRIPGGTTWVGAQKQHPDLENYDEVAEDEEQPVHQVYTEAFEIGKYPVTVYEYARFIDDGGYQNQSFWDPAGWEWRKSHSISWPENWDAQLAFPNRPVVYVNWHEAYAYCNWLPRRDEEMNYRLPTEAEWEYVARHGQEAYSRYCFGHVSPQSLQDQINWDHGGLRHLSPVGLFSLDASRDGVMDMNGNVKEWVFDSGPADYQSDPIPASLANNQPSRFRYLRGGSWHEIGRHCRSASRGLVLSQNRYDDLGFRVVRRLKSIPLKGKLPANRYQISLAEVYTRHTGMIYSHEQTEQMLAGHAARFPGLSIKIISQLFPENIIQEHRRFDRLPCILGNAPPTKFDLNLLYQDTRLKLAVEEKLGPNSEPRQHEQEATALMDIVSILLSTTGIYQHELWQDLTDNDLDALIFMVLDQYDPQRQQRLLETGYRTNELALAGLQPSVQQLSLEELIQYQVFAGTVWWEERGLSLNEQFVDKGALEINDIELFKQNVLTQNCHLIFFFANNGELVWDLALILRLLNANPYLKVTGVVSKQIVANNSNSQTLNRCLEQPIFHELQNNDRFKIFEEDNFRSAIDPSLCSKELLALLESSQLAIIKGVASFETMQKPPVDAYYAFVVHSTDSQDWSGYQKGSGIFVRLPRGSAGYSYPKQTLRDFYATLKSR